MSCTRDAVPCVWSGDGRVRSCDLCRSRKSACRLEGDEAAPRNRKRKSAPVVEDEPEGKRTRTGTVASVEDSPAGSSVDEVRLSMARSLETIASRTGDIAVVLRSLRDEQKKANRTLFRMCDALEDFGVSADPTYDVPDDSSDAAATSDFASSDWEGEATVPELLELDRDQVGRMARGLPILESPSASDSEKGGSGSSAGGVVSAVSDVDEAMEGTEDQGED